MPEVKRASLDKVLEFANAVREAGGGNPLDALIPATPEDPSRCLIAKNLNFNCTVGAVSDPDDSRWIMAVTDREIRDRIAEKLDLDTYDAKDIGAHYASEQDEVEIYGVYLPPEIGQVAEDFDNAWVNLCFPDKNTACVEVKEDLELIRLVEESVKEARGIASIVNEDGSIVI